MPLKSKIKDWTVYRNENEENPSDWSDCIVEKKVQEAGIGIEEIKNNTRKTGIPKILNDERLYVFIADAYKKSSNEVEFAYFLFQNNEILRELIVDLIDFDINNILLIGCVEAIFKRFLASRRCMENYDCFVAAKHCSQNCNRQDFLRVIQTFVANSAMYPINISNGLRKELLCKSYRYEGLQQVLARLQLELKSLLENDALFEFINWKDLEKQYKDEIMIILNTDVIELQHFRVWIRRNEAFHSRFLKIFLFFDSVESNHV